MFIVNHYEVYKKIQQYRQKVKFIFLSIGIEFVNKCKNKNIK